MTISDETLMAYADGELDPAARTAVESAMRADPQIEKRIAAHRSLRHKLQSAYAADLQEAVPERLLTAARIVAPASGGKVVNLQDVRSAVERNAPRARTRVPPWRTAGAIAASVIAGVGLGFFMWGQTQRPLVQGADGVLVARGRLAQALSNQLAAEQSKSSAVQIGLSYVAKSGDYCRTFTFSSASSSGLACRHRGEWQVQALTQGAGADVGSEYRTAASPMSATVLKSVEEQIAGEPLDQAGERAARRAGWQAAVR